MPRYIDADGLKEQIPKDIHEDVFENCSNCELLDDEQVKELIDLQPTADVRENVRGEWLPHPNNKEWDICSACGTGCKRREFGIHANGDKWVTEYNFPFCPNCGADMRKPKLQYGDEDTLQGGLMSAT